MYDYFRLEYDTPKTPKLTKIIIIDPFTASRMQGEARDTLTLEILDPNDHAWGKHPWIFYPEYTDSRNIRGIYMDDESARALANAIIHELEYNR